MTMKKNGGLMSRFSLQFTFGKAAGSRAIDRRQSPQTAIGSRLA